MRRADDERLYVALVIVIVAIAGITYLSGLPRDPLGGALQPAARAEPFAARPATPVAPPRITRSVALAVTVWPNGPGRTRVRRVIQCPPMTSACRTALARRGLLMRELPGPCPSGRTGAAEAVVDGDVAGRHVVAWVDRRDGCGSRRWSRLAPLLRVAPAPRSRTGSR